MIILYADFFPIKSGNYSYFVIFFLHCTSSYRFYNINTDFFKGSEWVQICTQNIETCMNLLLVVVVDTLIFDIIIKFNKITLSLIE